MICSTGSNDDVQITTPDTRIAGTELEGFGLALIGDTVVVASPGDVIATAVSAVAQPIVLEAIPSHMEAHQADGEAKGAWPPCTLCTPWQMFMCASRGGGIDASEECHKRPMDRHAGHYNGDTTTAVPLAIAMVFLQR